MFTLLGLCSRLCKYISHLEFRPFLPYVLTKKCYRNNVIFFIIFRIPAIPSLLIPTLCMQDFGWHFHGSISHRVWLRKSKNWICRSRLKVNFNDDACVECYMNVNQDISCVNIWITLLCCNFKRRNISVCTSLPFLYGTSNVTHSETVSYKNLFSTIRIVVNSTKVISVEP